jgi:hypothetical protein
VKVFRQTHIVILQSPNSIYNFFKISNLKFVHGEKTVTTTRQFWDLFYFWQSVSWPPGLTSFRLFLSASFEKKYNSKKRENPHLTVCITSLGGKGWHNCGSASHIGSVFVVCHLSSCRFLCLYYCIIICYKLFIKRNNGVCLHCLPFESVLISNHLLIQK